MPIDTVKGHLHRIPEESEFFDRIERMIDSNDVLDNRDISWIL